MGLFYLTTHFFDFKRYHHHVVEITSLLSYISFPLTFWTHDFGTNVYFINFMFTLTFSLFSDCKRIFGLCLNYSKLNVFSYLFSQILTFDRLEMCYIKYVCLYVQVHTSYQVVK